MISRLGSCLRRAGYDLSYSTNFDRVPHNGHLWGHPGPKDPSRLEELPRGSQQAQAVEHHQREGLRQLGNMALANREPFEEREAAEAGRDEGEPVTGRLQGLRVQLQPRADPDLMIGMDRRVGRGSACHSSSPWMR